MTTSTDGSRGMRIGELSEQTGASVRSIRHYERWGLLSANRQDNGYRSFSGEDVERVRRIRTFLSIGLNLEDVYGLSACLEGRGTADFLCAEALERYRHRLGEVEARISDLEKVRDILADHVRAAQAAHVRGVPS